MQDWGIENIGGKSKKFTEHSPTGKIYSSQHPERVGIENLLGFHIKTS